MAARSADVAGAKHAKAAARRKPRAPGHPAATDPPQVFRAAPGATPLGLAIGVALLGAALRGEPADEALEPAERYGDFA